MNEVRNGLNRWKVKTGEGGCKRWVGGSRVASRSCSSRRGQVFMDICDFGDEKGHKVIAEVIGLHMIGKGVGRFGDGSEKGKESFGVVAVGVD